LLVARRRVAFFAGTGVSAVVSGVVASLVASPVGSLSSTGAPVWSPRDAAAATRVGSVRAGRVADAGEV
jgi:hypothetical protein